MYSPERVEEERPLSKIIESKGLPISVRVTRTCTLRDEPVISEGQTITVLNKQWVHLMYGKNWSDRTFRINIARIKEELMQIVEEFYVTDTNDMKEVTDKCKYVQLKIPFVHKFYEFEKCDKFIFKYSVDNPDTILLTSIRLGITLDIPSSEVYDWKKFVFIKPGEKLTVNNFVKRSKFKPVSAEFDGRSPELPVGVVRIEELPIYETILTVTKCSDTRIKYEFFPLHLSIPAICLGNLLLPKQLPYDLRSQECQQKFEEFEFVMHFDIYEARFYGSVEYEEELRALLQENNTKSRKSNLSAMRKSKSFSDFNSLGNENSVYESHDTNKSFDDPIREKKKRSTSVLSSFRKKLVSPSREKQKSFSKPRFQIKESPQEGESKDTHVQGETKIPIEPCNLKSYKKTSPDAKSLNNQSSPNLTNMESENALYGELTLVRQNPVNNAFPRTNPKRISPTDVQPLVSIKSAQFSEKDIMKRKTSTPLSMEAARQKATLGNTRRAFSVSPSDNQITWENSPPKIEKPKTLSLVKSYSVEIEFPMGTRKQSFQEKQRRRAATPEAVFTNNDSGIDSPEARKSSEKLDVSSIRKLFEKNSTSTTVQKNEKLPELKKLDLRNRSASETKIIESPSIDNDVNTGRPKSMFVENLYESVNYADVKNSFNLRDPLKQREVDSIRIIKVYDIESVVAMLRFLNLDKYERLFRNHQADGSLITDLTETGFHQMNMKKFDARKLYKFIHGWRPRTKSSILLEDEVKNPYVWSISDTCDFLKGVQLKNIGNFCVHNQIDGELLLDLVDTGVIKEITELKSNSFELRKLSKFVHGWRPKLHVTSQGNDGSISTEAINWSTHCTYEVLKKINLDRLGKFCLEQQIDGELLLDLIECELIFNLPEEYGLSMIEIERKRLQRQVKRQVDSKLKGYF